MKVGHVRKGWRPVKRDGDPFRDAIKDAISGNKEALVTIVGKTGYVSIIKENYLNGYLGLVMENLEDNVLEKMINAARKSGCIGLMLEMTHEPAFERIMGLASKLGEEKIRIALIGEIKRARDIKTKSMLPMAEPLMS